MTRPFTMILLANAIFYSSLASGHALGWEMVQAKVRRDFPQVRSIRPAQLAEWLGDKGRPAPLLLDVRTRAEYEVSHLRNAVRVEPEAGAADVRVPQDRAVVTYCSVGYRSAAFAEKLRAAGHGNVVNLEGSIFQWANEGRPVYRGGKEVRGVHPYNRIWGVLLRKEHRAENRLAGADRN